MIRFLFLALAATASAVPFEERDQKSISLFSVVSFSNDECQTKSDKNTQGICYSSSDCSAKGGLQDGNCASGFGVCCKFILESASGGSIAQNCSYAQNKGYPSTVTTASQTVTYTIKAISTDICQLRFDFVNVKLGQTTSSPIGSCLDTLLITSPTGKNPPTICGSGQTGGFHMYSEVGTSSTSTTMVVTTNTATTTRSWKVKVSQIECSNMNKPPTDCVQWYTATSGSVKTLNFDGGLLLTKMNYAICFRHNKGMCSMQIVADTFSSPDPFGLSDSTAVNTAASSSKSGGYGCTGNHLAIPNTANIIAATGAVTKATGIYCGGILNASEGVTANPGAVKFGKPFQIHVITVSAAHATNDAGAALIYTQFGSCGPFA